MKRNTPWPSDAQNYSREETLFKMVLNKDKESINFFKANIENGLAFRKHYFFG
jgi:hypothetical protein